MLLGIVSFLLLQGWSDPWVSMGVNGVGLAVLCHVLSKYVTEDTQ